MKRKVSTIMEDSLFRRAKLEAVRQGRPLAAILEDALQRYFEPLPNRPPGYKTVDECWGILSLPAEVVRQIMEGEEDEYGES
jgi:hypothetical protein